MSCFFLFEFFHRARPCSHLFAVLRLLVDFNDPKVDTLVVRRAELFWLN
jgi:hypothetical protein